jgi:5S rRNA maturation endonuclease (ribonuclease M5)
MKSASNEEFESALSSLSDPELALIVEGKKDRAALEGLGLPVAKIFVLSRQPLFEVAEAVAQKFKSAAILTDLDPEGKKLYGKLNTLLQQNGVQVKSEFRNFLFRFTKLRQIEALANYINQN